MSRPIAESVCDLLNRLGMPAVFLGEVGSTQDEGLRIARGGCSPRMVVTAVSQVAGRGRQGRVWISPQGGFYASLIACPVDEPPAGLTVRVGAAVVDSLRRGGVTEAVLKWPNDCLVGGRKLCGVLAEFFPRDRCLLVGVGLNVEQVPHLDLARELPGGYDASCLAGLGDFDQVELCAGVMMAVSGAVDAAMAGEDFDVDLVNSMLWSTGPVSAGSLSGMVEGLDASGRLLLRGHEGTIACVEFGEVRDACRH